MIIVSAPVHHVYCQVLRVMNKYPVLLHRHKIQNYLLYQSQYIELSSFRMMINLFNFTLLFKTESLLVCFRFLGNSVNRLNYWYAGKSLHDSKCVLSGRSLNKFFSSSVVCDLVFSNKILHFGFQYRSPQCLVYVPLGSIYCIPSSRK